MSSKNHILDLHLEIGLAAVLQDRLRWITHQAAPVSYILDHAVILFFFAPAVYFKY